MRIPLARALLLSSLLPLFICPSCARKTALVVSDKAFEAAFPGSSEALAEGARAAGFSVRSAEADLDALPSSLYDLVGGAPESTILLSPLLSLEASSLAASWPEKTFAAPGTASAPESGADPVARALSDPAPALARLSAAASKLPGQGPSLLILLSGEEGDTEEEAFRSAWTGAELLVKRGVEEGPGTEALLREALATKPRFIYLSLKARTADALESIRASLGSPKEGEEGPQAPVTAGRSVSSLALAYGFIRWSVEDDWAALAEASLEGREGAPARLIPFPPP